MSRRRAVLINTDLALLGGAPVAGSNFTRRNPFGEEEVRAVSEALQSGVLSGFLGAPGDDFLGGPIVKTFERAWRERFSVMHAVSVNSATSGLIAAVGAGRIGPGDEVIVPPLTMSATAVAPLAYGAIPIFADVDLDTFCIAPDAVLAAITPRTRAIIAVNLFGHPAPLAALRQIADDHGLLLIEDNAQAPLAGENGQLAGTVGHIGVFSLNVHKHINTGEGGMCVTADDELADRLQLIRNHGENAVATTADISNLFGFNLRMTELTAAVGVEQLKKLDHFVAESVQIAEMWTNELADLEGIIPPVVRSGCDHVYYTWAMRYDAARNGLSREVFSKALAAEGIPHSVGYVDPLYRLPLFQRKIGMGRDGFPFNVGEPNYASGLCPNAEQLHDHEFLRFDTCTFDVASDFATSVVLGIRKVHENRHKLAAA